MGKESFPNAWERYRLGLKLDPADAITRYEGFHGARVSYQQFHRPVLIQHRLIDIHRQQFDLQLCGEVFHGAKGMLAHLIRDGIILECLSHNERTLIILLPCRILKRFFSTTVILVWKRSMPSYIEAVVETSS